MSFGVKKPTEMSFSIIFATTADAQAIGMVTEQLMEDGWRVSYDQSLRKLVATHDVVEVKPPTIIQGPPDMTYMAKKAWDAYAEAVGGTTYDDEPLPDWDGLGDRQKAGWIEAARAVYPCQ